MYAIHENEIRQCVKQLMFLFAKYERMWQKRKDSNVRNKLRNVRLKLDSLRSPSARPPVPAPQNDNVAVPVVPFIVRLGNFMTENLGLILASYKFIRVPLCCSNKEKNNAFDDRNEVTNLWRNIVHSLREMRKLEPQTNRNDNAVVETAMKCIIEQPGDDGNVLGDFAENMF